jgi:hypothetical protein
VVATVAPGQYTFIAWSEGTPALSAQVEAGKIYYIEMGMTIGAWSARARLFGVGPSRKNWSELPTWLRESKMAALKPGAAELFKDDKGDDIAEVVEKGKKSWEEYDAEAREQRSLTAADGVDKPAG